jgi:hypothetical protein
MTQALVHHGDVDTPVQRLEALYVSASEGTHPMEDDTLRRLFEQYVDAGDVGPDTGSPAPSALAGAKRAFQRLRRSR